MAIVFSAVQRPQRLTVLPFGDFSGARSPSAGRSCAATVQSLDRSNRMFSLMFAARELMAELAWPLPGAGGRRYLLAR
jgi:hypothetical protein